MAPAVAKKLNGDVITSSPGSSSALRGRSSASVPDAHAMASRVRQYPAMAHSSSPTAGPMMNCCDSTVPRSAAVTSSRMVANCARRSSSGTGI
jgi:hypothetical protein